MKKYKAKVIEPIIGRIQVLVFICRVWRVFSVPFSLKTGQLKPYKNKSDAKRGAEKVAEELGIKLMWEGKNAVND